eukprot:6214099-Pleurochrysis_carterae.AAC.2
MKLTFKEIQSERKAKTAETAGTWAKLSAAHAPKKVTLGLRIPTPQTSHAGTLNFCKSCLEMRISVSPSGRCCAGSIRACKCALPTPAWRSHQWFSATSLRCSATRGVTERQCMHPTRWLEPCSSITASLPACAYTHSLGRMSADRAVHHKKLTSQLFKQKSNKIISGRKTTCCKTKWAQGDRSDLWKSTSASNSMVTVERTGRRFET